MCVSNSRVNSVTERVKELVMKESDPQRTQSHGCTGATSLRTSAGEDALDGVGVSNDYLESLQETEVPPHKMTMWRGQIVMIVRNLNAQLMNGTRVVVDHVGTRAVRVVDPRVCAGHDHLCGGGDLHALHFIPRILFAWTIPRTPMRGHRQQLPLRPAYAMTANKAQDMHQDRPRHYQSALCTRAAARAA